MWTKLFTRFLSMKLSKFVLFLDWLSGAKFGLGVLKEVSGQLNKEERKVTISVVNKSGYKWQAINAYIKHGTADLALPYEVPKGKINVNNRKV